jgi:ankyrin repeat protein
VRVLLEAKADVNAMTANGLTALIPASKFGYVAIVKALLAAGADVNARTRKGETALSEAAEHPEVQSLLEQAAARR